MILKSKENLTNSNWHFWLFVYFCNLASNAFVQCFSKMHEIGELFCFHFERCNLFFDRDENNNHPCLLDYSKFLPKFDKSHADSEEFFNSC